MPEPYWPKRKGSYRLSNAEKNARHGRIRCTYCKRTIYFLVSELRVAFGDIECDDLVYVARWRCTGCDGKGSLDFRLEEPPAAEAQSATLRKLVRVDYVRVPQWQDRKGL